MITFDTVGFSFQDREVLHDICVEMSEHRIGIIGGNGSGKSTLARLAAALIRPSLGHVSVNGLDTAADVRKVRSQVGFIFQDPDLQIVMPTVSEDLAFSLRGRNMTKDELASTVTQWLDRFDLTSHRDHPAHLLSGGQKQLLAIAAILIAEPKIVVFDEPTTLLDLRNKRRIMDVITNLTQQVIVVTHDLDFLEDFDRVIVIDDGSVVADGEPSDAISAYRKIALNS